MAEIVVERTYGAAKRAVVNGLTAYNRSKIGPRRYKQLAVTVRDDDGGIVGGVTGILWGEWLFIELLWIDERFRGHDYGTKLLDALGAKAKSLGATNVYVDTMSFQAPEFYRKLGFRDFGRLEGFLDDHTRYWLTKPL